MIKPGVSVAGIRPEIVLALLICKPIVESYDVEFVITSCTDGKHGRGSLHYVGFAVDLRTRDFLLDKEKKECRDRCAAALGKQYDVALEDTHMHIEFQPK